MNNRLRFYAYVKSKVATKDFYDMMEAQITNIDSLFNSLRADGWSGVAADETDEIYAWMKLNHENTLKALNDWRAEAESLQTTGVEAVKTSLSSIMSSFGGAGGAYGSNLGYDADFTTYIESAIIDLITSLSDIDYSVSSAQSSAKLQSSDYGVSSEISAIQQVLEDYREYLIDFQTKYISSVQLYDDYLRDMNIRLATVSSSFNAQNNILDRERPKSKVNDISSPIYRAYELARLLSELPEGDRQAIDELMYVADEPFRTIFFAHADKYHIASLDGFSGQQFAIPVANQVVINTANDSIIAGTNCKEWYATLFHELGHIVDYNNPTISWPYDNSLANTITTDIKYNLELYAKSTIVANINPKPTQQEIENAISNIVSGERIDQLNSNPSNQDKLQFYMQFRFQEMLRGNIASPKGNTFNSYEVGDASDVYGIATQNVLRGTWGHDNGYWLIPGAAQLELFAHNFSAGMLNYKVKQDVMDEYFPNSKAQLEKDMDNIYAGAQGMLR